MKILKYTASFTVVVNSDSWSMQKLSCTRYLDVPLDFNRVEIWIGVILWAWIFGQTHWLSCRYNQETLDWLSTYEGPSKTFLHNEFELTNVSSSKFWVYCQNDKFCFTTRKLKRRDIPKNWPKLRARNRISFMNLTLVPNTYPFVKARHEKLQQTWFEQPIFRSTQHLTPHLSMFRCGTIFPRRT